MDYLLARVHLFPGLWGLFVFAVVLAELVILGFVFRIMGVPRRYLFVLLVLCFVGSYVNLPVAELPSEQVRTGEVVHFFGVRYLVPVIINHPGTVVAVNLGGAVIPVMLSLCLMFKHRLFSQSVLGVGIVALAVHLMAQAVPGVGISIPVFVPGLIAAIAAVSISRSKAAPLAYIIGTFGTLVGADLMNLGKLQGLSVPVASIGGAGKSDGIFLTGVLAVLLAAILGGRVWKPPRIEPHQDSPAASAGKA